LSFDHRATALFGTNYFISIGIMKTLHNVGVWVPEDINVIGFDDLPPTMVVDPILTVAAQPAHEMGKQAAELLLNRLSGTSSTENQEIILPTEIIECQSSGSPID
jgi:DNA-binding LacI/PurR family transcriptional regulator